MQFFFIGAIVHRIFMHASLVHICLLLFSLFGNKEREFEVCLVYGNWNEGMDFILNKLLGWWVLF